jgi:hypothetical protein
MKASTLAVKSSSASRVTSAEVGSSFRINIQRRRTSCSTIYPTLGKLVHHSSQRSLLRPNVLIFGSTKTVAGVFNLSATGRI